MILAHITHFESPLIWFAFLGGCIVGFVACTLVSHAKRIGSAIAAQRESTRHKI